MKKIYLLTRVTVHVDSNQNEKRKKLQQIFDTYEEAKEELKWREAIEWYKKNLDYMSIDELEEAPQHSSTIYWYVVTFKENNTKRLLEELEKSQNLTRKGGGREGSNKKQNYNAIRFDIDQVRGNRY